MSTTAVLYLRGMPRALIREAKIAAAQQGTTLTRLVASALTSALGSTDEASLASDIAWYEMNRSRLLSRYRGDYVAVHEASIVDHDRDFEALAQRVFKRLGVRPVFMPRVESVEAVRKLRSPRVVRE